jgi:hypothetical protein
MLLPFVEQTTLWDILKPDGKALPRPNTLYNGVALLQQPVPVFRCASDTGPPTNQFYPYTNNSSAVTDRYATSNYAPNQNLVYHNADLAGGKSFRDCTDGTTNTLLLAERRLNVDPRAKRYTGAIIWGRTPATDGASAFHANWRINYPNDVNDFHAFQGATGGANGCRAHVASSAHPGGAQFTLTDGSVQFISENIATNPASNVCTGSGTINFCGPGFVYQNLYQPNDGNPVSAVQ